MQLQVILLLVTGRTCSFFTCSLEYNWLFKCNRNTLNYIIQWIEATFIGHMLQPYELGLSDLLQTTQSKGTLKLRL